MANKARYPYNRAFKDIYHFDECIDEFLLTCTRTVIETDSEGNPILNDSGKPIQSKQWVRQPSVLNFAVHMNIDKDTVYEWAKKFYPNNDQYNRGGNRSDSYKRLLTASENYLQNRLDNPKANTVGTIFALKNNFNWKDKREIETNHTQTHQLEGISTEELRLLLGDTEEDKAI